MPSGITPWSGGPRSPLTYNLMPGQFRNSRVSIFPSQTVINNNIGSFGNYGCYDDCCGGGNKMGWFGWTMLGGMGLSFLGNLFTGIFGGGSKPDGAGDTPTPEKPLDLKSIKEDAKVYSSQFDVKIDVLSDGTLLCNKEKYKDFDELLEVLKNDELLEVLKKTPKNKVETPETTERPESGNGNDSITTTVAPKAHTLEGFDFGNNFKVKELQDDKTRDLKFSSNATTTLSGDKGTNIDAPKTITIKDGNKQYKFELIDDINKLVGGQPMYKCTNNGTELTGNKIQEYILNKNGQFYQDKNTSGYGTALGREVKTS